MDKGQKSSFKYTMSWMKKAGVKIDEQLKKKSTTNQDTAF